LVTNVTRENNKGDFAFVATVELKGATDMDVLNALNEIWGSRAWKVAPE